MKLGSTKKPKLTKSPFVKELEYGCKNEGYWSYEARVLKLEDYVGILKYTHPEFEILVLFGHSNGHDRVQPNGVNCSKIGIKRGGKQPFMRSSKLL